MELGVLFCSALYKEDLFTSIISERNITEEHFFDYAKTLFNKIMSHYTTYGKLPAKDTILNDFDFPSFNLFFDMAPEPIQFYADQLVKRYELNILGSHLKLSIEEYEKAKLENLGSEKSVEVLQNAIKVIKNNSVKKSGSIINMKENIEIRKKRYLDMKSIGHGIRGFLTPWQTLDLKTNGIDFGEFWLVAGRPKVGKSFASVLFFEAARKFCSAGLCKKQGPPIFISMEMSVENVHIRCDAIRYHVPVKSLKIGKLNMFQEKSFFEEIEKKEGSDYFIIGNKAVNTTNDVAMIIDQYSPSILIIDSIWKFNNGITDETKKVCQISRDLSDLAVSRNIPIVASAQLKRPQKEGKRKQKQSVGIEDIALSDALGQDAHVILALSQDPDMARNKILLCSVVGARDGEPGNFLVNWDHDLCNYNEIGECDEYGELINNFNI